jgi:hypothetical protein
MGKMGLCAKCRKVFNRCIFNDVENPVENVQNLYFRHFFQLWEISGNVTKKAIDSEKTLIQGEKLNLSIFL